MSWHPNDLVTDRDLVSYERTILTQFGQDDWLPRRRKALEDWLFPLLEGRGFDPQRLRTRHQPVAVVGTTSSVSTDKSSAAATADGLNLATILAAASDYLYIGFKQPFYGLSIRMLDSVSAVSSSAVVSTWQDGWRPVQELVDGTRVGVASFAKGGAITWDLDEALTMRLVNSLGPYYWVRLSLSAAPTAGTSIGPVYVIRRSRLCAAVTFRTLALIFREAPVSQDGPWMEKAAFYEGEAERAFARVADHIGGEFDTDGDDAIDEAESQQTAAEVSGGGWRWERC